MYYLFSVIPGFRLDLCQNHLPIYVLISLLSVRAWVPNAASQAHYEGKKPALCETFSSLYFGLNRKSMARLQNC